MKKNSIIALILGSSMIYSCGSMDNKTETEEEIANKSQKVEQTPQENPDQQNQADIETASSEILSHIDPFASSVYESAFTSSQASLSLAEADETETLPEPVESPDEMTDEEINESALTQFECDQDGDLSLSSSELAECQAILEAKKEELMAKYDTNADGVLDLEERQALAADISASAKAKFLDRFDSNENGQIDAEDVAAAKENVKENISARVEMFIDKYDVDGDGSLDSEERAEAKADFKNRMLLAKEAFIEKHDQDGDGNLENELAQASEAIKAKISAVRAERLAKYDTNGNGRIGPAERRAMVIERRTARKERRLAHFDADGDGEISEEEVKTKVEERVTKVKTRISTIRADYDENGDGVLSQEEFKAFIADVKAKKQAIVDQYDENGDGMLDRDEAIEAKNELTEDAE